ncbi:MAG: hypothetical protein WBN45_13535 [Arenicellales bacterium]|jgi:hypothetical protein
MPGLQFSGVSPVLFVMLDFCCCNTLQAEAQEATMKAGRFGDVHI